MIKLEKTAMEQMVYQRLDEKDRARLCRSKNAYIELEAGEYVIVFHYCNVERPSHPSERVALSCTGERLLIATDSAKCIAAAKAVEEDATAWAQLGQFLLGLTVEDIYNLEDYEDRINDIEDSLLTTGMIKRTFIKKISGIRRELLRAKRYYEQLALISDELAQDLGELFDKDEQKHFVHLSRRVERLLGSVASLREYVTQVREAYQAQIDIEQNNIMKIFTVITAIFLPLTLIVGWYGMNFSIPEYGWSFGYPMVITLSVVTVCICVYIFKKKKWF